MELGQIFDRINELPPEVRKVLLSMLGFSEFQTTPAGAVLIGMQLLTLLGIPLLIDHILREEHTSLDQLREDYKRGGEKTVPSPGIVISLLIADILAYPKEIVRIYKVQELAYLWHTGPILGIHPEFLNDDRILNYLSKLGANEHNMHEILHRLVITVAQNFNIPLSRFFLDTIILQLSGQFSESEKVKPGRGRDSLSQLLISITSAAGSRLPVSFGVLPGNTNDAQTLEDSARAIDHLAPPGPVELIMDRAFPSGSNILFLQNQSRDFFFIAPLATDRAGKAFQEVLDKAWEENSWKQINYASAQEIKYKRQNTYTCFETTWTLTATEKPPLKEGEVRRPKGSITHHEIPVRCVVYRNSNSAKAECKTREEKIARCDEALIELSGKLNKRDLQTVNAAEKKANEILNKFSNIKRFIHLDFSTNEHGAVLFSWAWDTDALIKEKHYDGIFAFLTNHPANYVNAKELIMRYRDRNQSEINFAGLKGLADIERFFVRLPERMDAYAFVKILAYFVLAFLRWYAQTNGQKGITELKIQEAFSKLAIGKIIIEPLDIPKWSVANDNKLAAWFRDSLGLPDPAPYVGILNSLVDINSALDRLFTKWLPADGHNSG